MVISADGTPIGWLKSGNGPPIVLIPGSTYDAAALGGLTALLSERYTCYAVDRRGRGISGDSPVFDIQREYEDVVAVVGAVGGPLTLFGHSYGAICALGAASLAPQIDKLILYEPPLPVDGPVPSTTLRAARSALREGDHRSALLVCLRDVVRLAGNELALVEQLPADWFETFAPTAIREMEAASVLGSDLAGYARIDIPTLLLLGTESPSHVVRATEALTEILGTSRVASLEGQAHNAILLAPDLVAQGMREFLEAPEATQ